MDYSRARNPERTLWRRAFSNKRHTRAPPQTRRLAHTHFQHFTIHDTQSASHLQLQGMLSKLLPLHLFSAPCFHCIYTLTLLSFFTEAMADDLIGDYERIFNSWTPEETNAHKKGSETSSTHSQVKRPPAATNASPNCARPIAMTRGSPCPVRLNYAEAEEKEAS